MGTVPWSRLQRDKGKGQRDSPQCRSAVGGKKAERAYELLNAYLEGSKNETKRNPTTLDRLLDDIKSKRANEGDRVYSDGKRGTAVADVRVPVEKQAGDGSRDRDGGKPDRSGVSRAEAPSSAAPPTRSAALEALGALGDTPAGRRARSASDAAAQAFRYAREAAQRSDEAAYATALGVLRHSAKELTDLAASGALPPKAASAANYVAAGIKTLPGKAADLPAVSADVAQAGGSTPQGDRTTRVPDREIGAEGSERKAAPERSRASGKPGRAIMTFLRDYSGRVLAADGVDISDAERWKIGSAIKSGNARLNKTAERGYVCISKNSYLFKTDGTDIVVIETVPSDTFNIHASIFREEYK